MIIFLIGFRGSGKSTIGKRLADWLQSPWIDSDDEVERRAGCAIAEIFATQGEEAFRDLERQVIEELLAARRTDREMVVISLGGGAVLDERTRRLISEQGRCVWLRASPEVLAARTVGDASRPPLTQLTRDEEIRELLARREPVYAECADCEIDTTTLPPDQAVERIADWLAGADKN